MNELPKQMRAVQLTGHGDLDQLAFRDDVPIPTPGPTDVLIKVGAAGVNNTDINTRTGWYAKSEESNSNGGWTGDAVQFPLIQGADVCGRVVAVGDQVDSTLLNQRVLVEPILWEVNGEVLDYPWYFGSDCDGGFADYTVVAARHAHRILSDLSDVELASFPCSYSAGENLLTRANVGANDVVLVTGASGGVGSAVVQLAKARGARVIAMTSASKEEQVLRLGADSTVLRDDDINIVQELGESSMDVVIDVVAGEQWPHLLEILKPFGRYATSGAIAGPFVELDVRTLYLKDLSLFGCTVLDEGVFDKLVKRIETDEIEPVVAKTFPLSQVAQAQEYFQSEEYVGKLVIDLSFDG